MKIGIPRALLYYRYGVLWETFIKLLGHEVVLSPQTNSEILDLGIRLSVDESCLPSKIFMGHTAFLADKCDCVLIPRWDSFNGSKVCVKFNALYDIAANALRSSPLRLISYNIDEDNRCFERQEFIKLGKTLGAKRSKALAAYKTAKAAQADACLQMLHKEQAKLEKEGLKVLLVSHGYNVFDNRVGGGVIGILRKFGVHVVLANAFNDSLYRNQYSELAATLYWEFNKELTGAVAALRQKVDGIILLTAFPCGPDSLVNELLVRRLKGVPVMHLVIDELSHTAGQETRIESFLDIISMRGKCGVAADGITLAAK